MRREIEIYNDNGDVQVTTLNLNNSLPFFNIPTIMEDNQTYESDDITNADPTNKIRLKSTGNDLKYIATIKNPYTDIMSALYFDSDNKELVLVTHPDYFLLKGVRGSDVELVGYTIGYYKESTYADSLSYPYQHTNLNITDVTKPDTYTQLILNIHGIKSRKTFRYRSNNTNPIYKDLNIVPFIKLKKSDVFGDANLPVYAFEPIGTYKFRAKYFGYDSPEYIYIPLVI